MKKNILLFFIIVFILNLLWEFLQYPLYNDLSKIPMVPHLILASLGDVLLISLIFIFLFLKNKGLKWFIKPKSGDYLFIILSGIIIASVIEIINLYLLKRWSYTSSMPVIFGIGLSPLLQLFATFFISLGIARRLIRKP